MVFSSFIQILVDFVYMVLSVVNTAFLTAFSMNIFLDLTFGHVLIIVIVYSVIISLILGGDNNG